MDGLFALVGRLVWCLVKWSFFVTGEGPDLQKGRYFGACAGHAAIFDDLAHFLNLLGSMFINQRNKIPSFRCPEGVPQNVGAYVGRWFPFGVLLKPCNKGGLPSFETQRRLSKVRAISGAKGIGIRQCRRALFGEGCHKSTRPVVSSCMLRGAN